MVAASVAERWRLSAALWQETSLILPVNGVSRGVVTPSQPSAQTSRWLNRSRNHAAISVGDMSPMLAL
jgi:hypothetical protein